MRLVPLLLSVSGLVGTVAALSVTAYSLRTQEAADPAREIRQSAPPPAVPAVPDTLATSSATQQPPEIVPDGAVEPPPAAPAAAPPLPRSVAPSVVAVPPVDPAALERVDPRPPLSDIAAAAPPKPPPPKPLLFQPVADAAGIIVAGGRTISIGGVAPLDDGETCDRQGGGTWPCGRVARTAFRAFLRGRAVTCDFPEGDVPDRLTTQCRIGQRDLGAWLVENGWARASGDAYAQQAKSAADGKRGMFGPGPSSLPPDLAGPSGDPAPPAAPETAGPADISILPSDVGIVSPSGGPGAATVDDQIIPGARAGEPPPVSPLPPPSSPVR